jgi:serine phosphatase RsbU (regulator of sigma subunit)
MALCYFQLAFINNTFGNNAEGMDLCKKCLAIREELNDDIGRAAVLNLIGVNYTKEKQYGKARETFMKSMNLRKPKEEFRGYFATQFRWTEFQIEIGDLEDAKQSAAEGLNAALGEKEWFGAMRFMHANARIAMLQNDDVKSQMYLEEAIKLAEERKFNSIAYELYELYSEFFQKTGKLKEALEYYKRFHTLKEEVLGAQSSSQLKSIQLMNQIESSRREAELERIRNVDLKNAFELIEEKNRDITDSIFYAQRIQQAILPSAEEFKKSLPSSFVLFKPRDIVSGDFYWLSETNQKIFFAAADCTGHGVPGAFMSMIGTTMLNEIVNEKQIHKPSDILFHLRESIVRSLKQTGAAGENKDGMDIALCCLDKKNNVLEFSGAHNPLWLLKSSGEFEEYVADKQPIGIFLEEKRNFTDYRIQLQDGDAVYIFTDGYADQFGGPKGKKFKYKQMQELITSNKTESMDRQCKILDETFLNWKQGLDQLDDVLVVGIKV